MIKTMIQVLLVALGVLTPNARAFAQTPAPAPQMPPSLKSTVPLRVQIVLSTYQGEKRISSVPYTLSVNASPIFGPHAVPAPFAQSQLRMGVKVPVPMLAQPTVDGKRVDGLITAGPISYQEIGTNIDCMAIPLDDGRFQLQISIEDSSFANTGATRQGDPPVIRTFRLSNQVALRDGQSTQFTAATDRVSGEVIRAEVTLNVVK